MVYHNNIIEYYGIPFLRDYNIFGNKKSYTKNFHLKKYNIIYIK